MEKCQQLVFLVLPLRGSNVGERHWTEKNCFSWAEKYFKKNLVGIAGENEKGSARITEVSKVNGDVDLNQRKGKIITLFDLSMTLLWEGTPLSLSSYSDQNWVGITKNGETVKGRIEIPEVAHDTDIDDYVVYP